MTAADDEPMQGTRSRRRLPRRTVQAVAIGVAVIILLLDQATKALAVAVLSARTIDLGFMDLRLVRNANAAFSLPVGIFPGFFLVVTVVVVVVVMRGLRQTDRASVALAFGMVTGGALGNAVDRMFRAPGFPDGAVVDFFDLRWWPVFNIADIAIVSGAGLLALLLSMVDREQRAAEQADGIGPSESADGLPQPRQPEGGPRA